MHVEDLKSLPLRVHGKDMHGVAMAEAGSIAHATVVVECRGAPEKLITAVAVDIRHAEIVIAIGKECGTPRPAGGWCRVVVSSMSLGISDSVLFAIARGVEPACLETVPVEVHRPCKSIGVIATGEDGGGVVITALQESHGSKIALTAVAIAGIVQDMSVVVPVKGAGCLPANGSVAIRLIEHGVEGAPRESVEDGEIFLPSRHSATAVAPVTLVVHGKDRAVRSRLADIASGAVD